MATFDQKGVIKGEPFETIMACLRKIALFSELDTAQLAIMARQMRLFSVEEGDLVFEEGETGNYVCFVVEGDLSVIKDTKSGEQAMITTLSGGGSIGEMALIDEGPRSATVIVTTAATLLTLTREDFHNLLSEHPQIGIAVLKAIARVLSANLRRTSTQLADTMLPIM